LFGDVARSARRSLRARCAVEFGVLLSKWRHCDFLSRVFGIV